jgi:hypothetical protein
MHTMTLDAALAKSAAFYDKACADNLLEAMRLLLDQGAEQALAEEVLTMQWASWVANRESYLSQVREQLEALQRGDYDPVKH